MKQRHVDTLLENSNRDIQARRELRVYLGEPDNLSGLIASLTQAVMEKLQCLNWVGVQPIPGPVAQIISMENTSSSRIELLQNIVEARTRKFSTRWEVVLADTASHDDSIQLEVLEQKATAIAAEIDDEFLRLMQEYAGGRRKILNRANGSSVLADEIRKQSARIIAEIYHRDDSSEGEHTYAILSSKDFDQLVEDGHATLVDSTTAQLGKIALYRYDRTGNDIVIGFKHDSIHAGLIYAPYMLISSAGVITDPTTFNLVMSLMTRHGLYVSPRVGCFYRQVYLTGEYAEAKQESSVEAVAFTL